MHALHGCMSCVCVPGMRAFVGRRDVSIFGVDTHCGRWFLPSTHVLQCMSFVDMYSPTNPYNECRVSEARPHNHPTH